MRVRGGVDDAIEAGTRVILPEMASQLFLAIDQEAHAVTRLGNELTPRRDLRHVSFLMAVLVGGNPKS
ncbi:MAG: hypothetical protein ACI8T1_002832 [Verrucomicrobiales bacterium]|jgi:hypothetical protein